MGSTIRRVIYTLARAVVPPYPPPRQRSGHRRHPAPGTPITLHARHPLHAHSGHHCIRMALRRPQVPRRGATGAYRCPQVALGGHRCQGGGLQVPTGGPARGLRVACAIRPPLCYPLLCFARHTRAPAGTCGHLRAPAGTHGHLRAPTGTHGHPHARTGTHGHPRAPTGAPHAHTGPREALGGVYRRKRHRLI